MEGTLGTDWITIDWKCPRLDQRQTALEPTWEVAKNSPDGEKSKEIGALLNLTQSTRDPVKISHTLIHLSRDEHITHFESGYEKQMSVILLVAACLNSLTFFNPDLAFTICIIKSV